MWLASAYALMGNTHCKCHSPERKSSLTQEICWERHKSMAASAWERSSEELSRRQALYRVSWGRVELSRMAWDWKDFDGLGLERFCDLVLVCLFLISVGWGLALLPPKGMGQGVRVVARCQRACLAQIQSRAETSLVAQSNTGCCLLPSVYICHAFITTVPID